MKRKIAVWTSTRADYGILTPVMEEINKNPSLKLEIIASGMHMEKKFGNTIELVNSKFPLTKSFTISIEEDTGKATLKGMSDCMLKLNEKFDEINPDIFLYLGDRFETYAAATTAVMRRIPVAHIHGGDKTKAGLDESFRHAITKISNIHFTATPKSKERIIKMGENEEYVFHVGSPSIDTILNKKLNSKKDIFREYGINEKSKLVLVIQHPETMQSEIAGEQMKTTLSAIEDKNLEALIIYPNNDPGHQKIIEQIESYRTKFHIYKNLPHIDYLSFLKSADILIGNSSSGMIDASVFPIAVINIGIRQDGRERGINVLDVPFKKKSIEDAINTALYSESYKKIIQNPLSPYGDGTSSKKITKILKEIEISPNLLQKQISY